MTFEIIFSILSVLAWLVIACMGVVAIWQLSDLQQMLRETLQELRFIRNLPPLNNPPPALEIAPILTPEEQEEPAPPFWNDVSQLSAAIKRITETGEVPDHDQLFALSPNDAYHAVADRIELLERQ